MVSILGGTEPRFKVGAQTSPAMVEVGEAADVKVPMLLMLSQDEPLPEFERYKEALKQPSHLECFSNMPHGWMSARADFKDAKMKSEYERGYQMAADFFAKYL